MIRQCRRGLVIPRVGRSVSGDCVWVDSVNLFVIHGKIRLHGEWTTGGSRRIQVQNGIDIKIVEWPLRRKVVTGWAAA